MISLTLLFLIPGTAQEATTLYVGSGPEDHFTDIKSALQSVSVVKGDTIIVRPGEYTGDNNKNLDFGGKDAEGKMVNFFDRQQRLIANSSCLSGR